MPRQTRRRHRGGSYTIPVRSADRPTDYDLFLLTGHGEITPEFYYIVPDNVLLLLPNMCGVPLAASKTATSYLFSTPEQAIKDFEIDFFGAAAPAASGAGARAPSRLISPFTVYLPGDILPLHQFYFSPCLGWEKFVSGRSNRLDFGFVGLFRPGALHKHPLLPLFKSHPYPNIYSLEFGIPTNIYQASSYKKAIAKTIQYFIVSKEYEYSMLGQTAAVIVGSDVDYRTKRDFYESFRKGDPKYVEPYINVRSNAVKVINTLIPTIPENLLNESVLKEKKKIFFLNEIVKPSEKPSIYLINTCRSLFEDATSPSFELASAYVPNMSKPSMKLVRTVSNVGKQEFNMKRLNEFRATKGLPVDIPQVIKYDALAAYLKSTIDAYNAEADTIYAPLFEAIQTVHSQLTSYMPTVRVKASETAEYRLEAAAAAASAAEEEETKARLRAELPKELESVKRLIKSYQTDLMYLKKGKASAEEIELTTSQIRELQESKKSIMAQLETLDKN
jgi:hypothetical protein